MNFLKKIFINEKVIKKTQNLRFVLHTLYIVLWIQIKRERERVRKRREKERKRNRERKKSIKLRLLKGT